MILPFKSNLYFFYSNKIYFKFNNINEFNKIYDINNNIKRIWLRESGPDARPLNLGSRSWTQENWVLKQDSLALGPDADALPMGSNPRALGQVGLQNPSDLGLHPCHTQATWVKRPFQASIFLGMEGNVLPKLIIILIRRTTVNPGKNNK